MNIAEMMSRKINSSGNMSLQSIQDGFKKLPESQLNEAVRIARQQGISETQINEGLRMIRSLKK